MPRSGHQRARKSGPRAAAARFAPPLALMALIFVFSARPDLNSGLGTIDLIGRKLIHMIEYGLLWWLWARALGLRRAWVAVCIALAYAASDEYHQTFVEGRHGTVVDVGIDAAGVALAWVLVRTVGERRRRSGSDPAALGGHEDRLRAVDGAELPVDVVQVRADRAGRE